MEQSEQTQIPSIQYVWATQQISPKIILTFDCGNEETIYTEKHNGTVILTYEARTKQLASPPSNFGPNNYSNTP